MGVFRADVDIPLCSAGRDGRNRHPLDEAIGVAFHDHAVGEGAAVTFVGVADDIFLGCVGLGDRAPFDAGREARPAPASQARKDHVLDSRGGTDLDGAPEAFKPLVCLVILQAKRIGDAATLENEPRLPLEKRMLLRFPDAQRMVAAFQESGVEKAGNVARLDRAIGDAPLRRLGFDHGLEPEHPARSVADDIERDAASLSRFLHSHGHFIRAKREGGGV